MATVGNLFINIRGKTEKFERDLKRSTRRVSKSFARDQERAMIQLREARERVGRMTTASPERFGAAMSNLRKSEHNVRMAESRQPRMEAWRRAYENRKEREKDKQVKRWSIEYEIYKRKRLAHEEHTNRRRDRLRQRDLLKRQASESMFGKRGKIASQFSLAQEAKSLIPLVFGVPAAALAFIVAQGRKAFASASQFAVMGPQGGRFIEANVGKMMDEMAFAQRGDVSEVMARTAELDRQTAFLWREVGLQFQVIMNYFAEQLGLDVASPKIKGDPGFVPGKVEVTQKMIDADLARKARAAGLTTGFPAYGAGF